VSVPTARLRHVSSLSFAGQTEDCRTERLAWLALLPVLTTALFYALPARLQAQPLFIFLPQALAYLGLSVWVLANDTTVQRLGLEPGRIPQGLAWGTLIGLVLGGLNVSVILWLIPWLPFGLSATDYSPDVLLAFVLLGSRLGPRFPAPFLALLLGGTAVWWFERRGTVTGLQTIGELSWRWPPTPAPVFGVSYGTDLFAGATAICLVGIIQHLSIAKALAVRADDKIEPKRELLALGVANIASGFLHGFPGSASFARSALSDLSGAKTRVSGFTAAIATAVIAALAAPLARYVTLAAIAGLLIATAVSIVDWKELGHVLTRDRHDRVVLGTTIVCVFLLPIHWAILIGLAVSIALFLRRVSRLHLVEMVGGQDGPFQEHEIDAQTGRSAITMLQVEGPLFFAHAEDLSETLRTVLGRGPRVTIMRMRRTQQIDFSVIAALDRVIREYRADGGRVVICGLLPELRQTLLHSPLGEAVGADFLLETTREVFGSAHLAIGVAEGIVDMEPDDTRPRFRVVSQQGIRPTRRTEPGEQLAST